MRSRGFCDTRESHPLYGGLVFGKAFLLYHRSSHLQIFPTALARRVSSAEQQAETFRGPGRCNCPAAAAFGVLIASWPWLFRTTGCFLSQKQVTFCRMLSYPHGTSCVALSHADQSQRLTVWWIVSGCLTSKTRAEEGSRVKKVLCKQPCYL